MTDVFVSYARSTQAHARRAARALEEAGYSVWIDDELPAHRAFSTVIEDQLRGASAVLVLWSEDARASRWVPAEADMAYNSDKLVQMSVDGALPPLPFNRMHCEMLSHWEGDADDPAWRKILDSVAELSGRGTGPIHPVEAVAAFKQEKPKRGPTENVLAVLAFDNLSSDPDLDYFCDGVSDEIQRTVARATSLKIVARASSFQFRGADKATAHVAAALGTTHLLDGTVRRGGDRVRISAELVECSSCSAIWADRFDGTLDDVFTLQEEIAESVAQALKVALEPAVAERPLSSIDYERFLRAKAHLAGGDSVFDDSAFKAIPLLEKVVDARPDFAPAWEMLATARATELRSGHSRISYSEGARRTREAAEQALSLDPNRTRALLALALLEPWGAYTKREELLDKALAASPNDPFVLTELSNFYWSVGRAREGIALAERAFELNPMLPAAAIQVAQMLAYVGEPQASMKLHRELYRRWPDNPGMLMALLNMAGTTELWDDFDEVVNDIEKFDGWQAVDLKASRAFSLTVRSKDPEKAKRRIARYQELLEATGTVPINIITGISVFGFPEEALDMAEKANYDFIFQPEGNRAGTYFHGTIFGPWSQMRELPRFVDLCDRLGLCRYWVESDKWPDMISELPYDFKDEVRKRVTAQA
ncbi:TIR domain-containing protein [Qipengyuania soli]|uniref:TIR domain-containing protein n=1 Tax=Qipengyuania soli TaxID=2782568 RepID=A0A7S8F4U5_9SPHN|nr:TIR domain-containing protein [Qipengyuania soli]QPC99127.1 TIR domain-containing protein [Qipengyuania soli]